MTTNDAVVLQEFTPLMHQVNSIVSKRSLTNENQNSRFVIRGFKSERERIKVIFTLEKYRIQ